MRNGSRALAAVLAATAFFVPINSGFSAPAAPKAMVTGAVTSQPIGHYEFCRSHRNECSLHGRANAPAPRITDRGWSVLRDINSAVNASVTPMTDSDIYGREEMWTYPTDVGDCEDFVLLKRKKLIEAGFDPSDLLITVVRKPDGEGHAVLTVRAAQGDYVLDNLNDEVRLWTATPYTYLKRQASFDSGRWVTIENGTTDLMVGALK
ncbi:MAG TPA: transglutaminase-like cysteine peptidase [Rhizobium sp.]|nr:transglutaminase-like cysteine peptidase [Rhizobium sp.]